MMEFNNNKPIYRQIVDYCFGQILLGNWAADQKIPSVRELSVVMGVNSHTVLKAYEFLQNEMIIAPRRGMGFYLAPDALKLVNAAQREEFFDTTLVDVYKDMCLLGISVDELVDHLQLLADQGSDA